MNDPNPSPRENDPTRRATDSRLSGSGQEEGDRPKPADADDRNPWQAADVGCAFGAMVLCAAAGLLLGPIGARMAGAKPVSSGSFDLSPLLYMAVGFIAGGGLFLVLLLFFRRGEPMARVARATLLAVIGSLFSGLAGYRVAKYDQARNGERDRQRAEEEAVRYNEYHGQLKEDPGVVVAERWYRYSPEPEANIRWRAYRDSLENPYVPYTSDMLSVLLAAEEDPFMARKILRDPRLDPHRLEEEFRWRLEALTGNRKPTSRLTGDQERDGRKLIDILSLPRAKEEWFAEVAASGVTGGEPAAWKDRLREMIRERQADQ